MINGSSSEHPRPARGPIAEIVTEIAEDAVLNAEPFPKDRIEARLDEVNVQEPYRSMGVALGWIAYADAIDIRNGSLYAYQIAL